MTSEQETFNFLLGECWSACRHHQSELTHLIKNELDNLEQTIATLVRLESLAQGDIKAGSYQIEEICRLTQRLARLCSDLELPDVSCLPQATDNLQTQSMHWNGCLDKEETHE